MQTRIAHLRQAARTGLLVALLLAGCQAREVTEPDHHIPEHKPADYPAAVVRLLELHAQLISQPASFEHSAGIDPFVETYDLARWLPELAADSDLPEQPWNRVDHVARQLERLLAPLLTVDGDEARAIYLTHQQTISELQHELIEVARLFPEPVDTAVTSDESLASNDDILGTDAPASGSP